MADIKSKSYVHMFHVKSFHLLLAIMKQEKKTTGSWNAEN